jgi:hypothetical protein
MLRIIVLRMFYCSIILFFHDDGNHFVDMHEMVTLKIEKTPYRGYPRYDR